MKTVALRGNTYPFRAALQALGGRWDPKERCFVIPEDREEEARALMASPEEDPDDGLDDPEEDPEDRPRQHKPKSWASKW